MEPKPTMTEPGDLELVRRCARGEESAFRELVGRVEKPLIHFILRYVGDRNAAEDLFQETFVRVLRNIADFSPVASLHTWIFTIARNLCLDRLKMQRRHREVSIDSPRPSEPGKVIDFREALRERTEGPPGRAQSAELGERVKEALSRLAPAKREAVVLRVYAGLEYQEIARISGSPVGTIKFRVHEAMREIADRLAEEGRSSGVEAG